MQHNYYMKQVNMLHNVLSDTRIFDLYKKIRDIKDDQECYIAFMNEYDKLYPFDPITTPLGFSQTVYITLIAIDEPFGH